MCYIGIIGDFIPCGPAGIIGDTMAVTALGGIPITVATQFSPNDLDLYHSINRACINAQLDALIEKPLDSIKIGVIQDIQAIPLIAQQLTKIQSPCPVVINIILNNNKGLELISPENLQAYEKYIYPLSHLITLGVKEAEILADIDIFTSLDLENAAKKLYKRWKKTVIITGSLLKGTHQYDVFVNSQGSKILSFSRIPFHIQNVTSYSGSSILSSALAVGLGQGLTTLQAINLARQYIEKTISTSIAGSKGYCLNLGCTIDKNTLTKPTLPYYIV